MASDSGNMPSMMVLGDYQFSINTLVFQEWARTTEWKWPAQERMGQLAAKQFTGRGEDSLELPGLIYPDYKGDIQSLDELRAMANDGLPYDLTDSMGFYQGRWVIERLDEKQSSHKTDGSPRKVEFTLRLSIYDDGEAADDGGSILGSASSVAAVATSAAGGTTAAALSGFAGMVKTVQSTAASTLGSLKSAAAQVQISVAPVLTEANSAIGALNRGMDVVKDLRNTAQDVAQQVQSIGNIGGALSGAKTILDKIDALGIHAASAGRIIDNISTVAGTLPTAAATALATAGKATTSVSTLLATTQSATNSLIKKFT
jgi:phage protein U